MTCTVHKMKMLFYVSVVYSITSENIYAVFRIVCVAIELRRKKSFTSLCNYKTVQTTNETKIFVFFNCLFKEILFGNITFTLR